MTLSEKAAYLKGLMDGLKLDTEKDENKVLAAVVDMLSDVAETVSDLEDVVDTISDELDCIEEDLDNIDDYLMDDDDDEYEHHHHHHHADEVFTSWGIETPNTYSAEDIEKILTALDSGEYGAILRAKGMVPAPDGTWVYYDYVPEEHDIRSGKPEVTGKICVIGSKLDEDKLAELFRK